MAPPNWVEQNIEAPYPYTPLIDHDSAAETAPIKTRLFSKSAFLLISGILAIGLLVGLGYNINNGDRGGGGGMVVPGNPDIISGSMGQLPRGVAEGVSAKSVGSSSGLLGAARRRFFPWSNRILGWERTAFHFQPKKNWMNDPNGPLFYKGWYHLFYQYNPKGAIWGNIVWGHAVSKDLINWRHLPIAMVADHWYDSNGVWTGSATILHDGRIMMLYTGSTNELVQVQNLAYPADPSDPLLIKWEKYPNNPVLVPPPGIHFKDFRDPTTAWYTPEGKWRFIIGSKINKTGIALVYETVDFKNYELLDGVLHGVPKTGMWECVDFYPVSRIQENGLDTSDNGPAVKHVIKTSLDDDRNDYYAIGTYDGKLTKWFPDDPRNDAGIGLRYDYGNFYASKTFYDQNKKRRILWGWITEKDSEAADIQKGWASLQAIPRTVLFDKKTGKNLLQWPVEEVEKLRTSSKSFDNVALETGSILHLDVGSATQLDITAEFEINKEAVKMVNGSSNSNYICSSSEGASQRGALGPFGLLVLTDKDQSEQTPVYFYIAKGVDGNLKTFFCADHSRSTEATDVVKGIYGNFVPVLEGEKLSMRVIVDHSIVESFAQGGRTCITSRIYPTKAIYEDAQLFLFNNATDAKVTANVKVWQMTSANI